MGYQDNLINSVYTGFVDSAFISLEKYRPTLLVNDRESKKKSAYNHYS